ncbi:MAG TPA: CehA/McbA family metallohydrolase [Burkholderiaceae bacterium]|jgi:hypothetical protein
MKISVYFNRAVSRLLALAFVSPVLVSLTPALAHAAPDLVIEGDFSGVDHQTYRYLPFKVPAGVTRVSVEFSYTGQEQKSTIDLGLFDPQGFRGWSGGNKAAFTLSASDATPSYLPGPIMAGTWRLALGVPNLRKDGHAHYIARISFAHAGDPLPDSVFTEAPLNPLPGWYRGDLHDHTGHSDGTCPSLTGHNVPCPTFITLQQAKAHGLDFIAVTDHNGVSQYNDLRELQPYFDNLLLIPGREITTFYGHANVFGTTEYIPFQLGSAELPTVRDLTAAVHAKGALISINHPKVPSGEACMGCGWTAPDTDFEDFDAIEVVNGGATIFQGGNVEGPLNGIPFWEARLNAGDRLAAIAGSDDHRPLGHDGKPGRESGVGFPTTVVYAEKLSQSALLDGLRHGRVFIDFSPSTVPSHPHVLDLEAVAGGQKALMGQGLKLSKGEPLAITAHIDGAAGDQLEVILNSQPVQRLAIADDQASIAFSIPAAQLDDVKGAAWVRVNVRDAKGRIVMISNPVYLQRGG